jgi:hypothetical protein
VANRPNELRRPDFESLLPDARIKAHSEHFLVYRGDEAETAVKARRRRRALRRAKARERGEKMGLFRQILVVSRSPGKPFVLEHGELLAPVYEALRQDLSRAAWGRPPIYDRCHLSPDG